MYAELGSGNGGVVVNLGMDGVACQTARRLPTEKNSLLDLRLRGAGLNVELAGEVVWLGATQKKVGIRFRNLSASVQKELADWIARETQLFGPVGMEAEPPSNAMPAMRGASATSAMPGLVPVDPFSSAGAGANESRSSGSLDFVKVNSNAAPLPENVSRIQGTGVTADKLDNRLPGDNADSPALPKAFPFEQSPNDDALFEPLPVEQQYHFPANNSLHVVLPTPLVHDALPKAAVQSSVETEFRKTEESEPSPVQSSTGILSLIMHPKNPLPAVHEDESQTHAATSNASVRQETKEIQPFPRAVDARLPDVIVETTAPKGWIPAPLLDAWNRGNRQQRLLLASSGVACLGAVVLILTLAVTQIGNFSSPPARGGSARQSTEPLTAPTATVTPARAGPIQAPPVPPAAISSRSRRPAPSWFANFVNTLLGRDPVVVTRITADQIGVQVWTSKSNGYYYCSDSEYYNYVQPGTFMTQSDALQSGYRPRLGKFCD